MVAGPCNDDDSREHRKSTEAMKSPEKIVWAVLMSLVFVPGVWAGQDQGESSSSKPAEQDQVPDQSTNPPAKKKGQKQGTKGTTAPDPAPPAAANGDDPISQRINNTAKAEHDVEVGRYYEKKDKFDAAIDRYKEAAQLLPSYGLPLRLMGEAYEKKHFLPEALQAYEKYLQAAPKADDAEDVRKRVARLRAEIQEDERRRASATKP
jgi:tetratricopeptide (TPR) repeat protein